MAKIEIELKRKGTDYFAEANYDTESNIVTIKKKKSKMRPTITGGSHRANDERNKIRRKKIVDEEGVFQEDYNIIPAQQGNENTPLARASEIIAGYNNGLSDWTIIDEDYPEYKGKTMQDWKREGKHSSGGIDDSVHTDNDMYLGQNIIFYGVPGCGKSHRINELLHLDDEKNGLKKEYYKRILFHPEYSYSDFVGQLRPVTEDGKITYEISPGPFTEILLDAYKDQEHDYFLIIEEINRGNAPAIFGDLFQLLDRKDGESEYSIDNKDILDYVEKRKSDEGDSGTMAKIVDRIKTDGIRIPKNLTIFATMNTCDQNVFTLDTAFKRRWRMSRIVNDFDKDSSVSEWKISFKSGGFAWKEFAKAVNDAILNNCNDGTAAEDKQLGTHFIKECDLTPARRFAEKVMLYLWDDVAKYDNKSQLFDTNKYKTLDMVIDGFAKGENVFSPNCAQLQELYNNMKPKQTDENAAGVPSGAEPGTDSSAKGTTEATDKGQGGE